MSETNETSGRCRRTIDAMDAGACVAGMRCDHIIADAIDRLAADVASIKARVEQIAPEDVRHFVESEKAWVRLVEEQRDAAIRERDEEKRKKLAWIEAVGLCSTAVPSMVIDADDPLGMARQIVAAVKRLRGELAARPAANSPGFSDSSPAAPQPAAPAAGWLTDEEKRCLPEVLDDLRRWGYAKSAEVIEAILARAGSPPVVEVPAFENYAPEVLHLRYRDALDKASVPWNEVPRE